MKPECNITKIYYSIGKKKGISIYFELCMSGLCWVSTILNSMLFDSYLIHCIWWWIYIYLWMNICLIQIFIVILFIYGYLWSFFCLSFSSSVTHHCFILLTHIENLSCTVLTIISGTERPRPLKVFTTDSLHLEQIKKTHIWTGLCSRTS